jgi:outer membrane lipoprotein-sorting protein
MNRYILYICISLFAIVLITGVTAEPDFTGMLRTIDDMQSFEDNDFSCVYTVVSQKPGEPQEVHQVRLFRRDLNDQFLLLILKPEVQKGQGYLQVDDNVWFYDPESRKFSHSSMKENVVNSDAKNSDFTQSSLAEDYDVVAWEEAELGKFPVYILDLQAKNNEVSYDKLKLWIRRDVTLVLKQESYSAGEERRLMRTAFFTKYTKVAEKYIPAQMLMVDNLKEGEKTQITLTDPIVSKLPDFVFTKAYLEKVNN